MHRVILREDVPDVGGDREPDEEPDHRSINAPQFGHLYPYFPRTAVPFMQNSQGMVGGLSRSSSGSEGAGDGRSGAVGLW